jgi:hypothetical protein
LSYPHFAEGRDHVGDLGEDMILKWPFGKLCVETGVVWIRTGTNGGLGLDKGQESSSPSQLIKDNKLNSAGCYELCRNECEKKDMQNYAEPPPGKRRNEQLWMGWEDLVVV